LNDLSHHRTVEEWVGKDADSRPPTSVRLRIFARHDGRCHISGVKIQPGDAWDVEHIKPLWQAQPGENLNRESNLAPALKQPHREKTAAENSARAKADRVRAKHLGIYPKSRHKIRSRGFPKSRGEL
jgi:5-methylcytosine-specific restriction endonuclease McrA